MENLAKTMKTLGKINTFAPAPGGAPLARGAKPYTKAKTLYFTENLTKHSKFSLFGP